MNASSRYDFIICGAGCAGLSLAVHLIKSGKFSDKKVLLIDKDPKRANDRTWCFWQKDKDLFEEIVYRQWERLNFYGANFFNQLQIGPYHYKMIRGIDFYEYAFAIVKQQANFEILFEEVEEISYAGETAVVINGRKIHADYIFNSILFDKPEPRKNEFWLLQHFKGWLIETGKNVFDEKVATLMDFRTDQKPGTAFCYVLPFNPRRALVEYTLFSPELLQNEDYDKGLRSYINDILRISTYQIVDQEFGVIPMTNHQFPSHQNKVINIGTAGGQTKGSSGYTFNFIQKHSKAIVHSLITTGKPFIKNESKRFHFYDGVLLNVLNDRALPGEEIFSALFRKNPVDRVFRFLDNESSLQEEIKIISWLPTLPFLKAGIRQIVTGRIV